MLLAYHAPSLHFHLGAWAVTAVCVFAAFWINFLRKRKWLPRVIDEYLHPDIVSRLEYVSHITGIIGLLGVLLSAYLGFIDASGIPDVSPIDLNAFLVGFDKAMGNEVLAFKVQWTFVGLQAFVFGGILRFYFVTIKRNQSVFDQHYSVQILYAEAVMIGFFLMVIVAGAGGIWVYGESILSGIPILEDFLPGGDLIVPFVVITGLLAMTFIVSAVFREKMEQLTEQAKKDLIPE